ncbi:MAG TPA: YncE family protein [Bryobacteraceae bacterium]|nr:YncE family protein [Bryobacteraceae bacterium]
MISIFLRRVNHPWLLLLAVPFCASAQKGSGYVNPQNPIIWGADQIMNFINNFGKPPLTKNYVPGQIDQYWKCVGGYWVMYRYYKTYPGVHGFTDDTGAFPTLFPCPDKGSTDPNGNPAPNPNSEDGPAYIPENIAQGSGPQPPGIAVAAAIAGADTVRQQLVTRAGPAGAAYEVTLPYRALPFLPFFPQTAPMISTSCASQLNPTGFAVDHVNGTVTKYAVCTSQPLGSVNVTSRPLQIRVTPDGSQAIVTSYDNGITFIDTATNQVTKAIRTDPGFFPSGIAISPGGSYALVTNYYDTAPELAVLNIATKSIAGFIPLDTPFPQSVFINPDATLAWVTYPWNNVVEVIDILTGVVVKHLVAFTPFDVAFSPTGTVAYIASGAGSVLVLDATTYTQVSSVPAGMGACDLSVSPDGQTVTVNNFLDGTITIFDTRLVPFGITMNAGSFPRGVQRVPLN